MLNLLTTTIASGSFKAFITALSRARLGYVLTEPGPFTILVPTDTAFFQAGGGDDWNLTNDIPTLKRVLACHVIPGNWKAALMVRKRSLRTFCGELVDVEFDKVIRVGGARVLRPDILADNGVIHIVDSLVFPRDAALAPELTWHDSAWPIHLADRSV